MNKRIRQAIDNWNDKWRIPKPNWRQPYGLECFAIFLGCYGFRVWGGYGWEKVHTLNFATQLQHTRKHSGNWDSFWKYKFRF